MIHIDRGNVQFSGIAIQLIAEFSHAIYRLAEIISESEEKPIGEITPIVVAKITGGVYHAMDEDQKRNAAE